MRGIRHITCMIARMVSFYSCASINKKSYTTGQVEGHRSWRLSRSFQVFSALFRTPRLATCRWAYFCNIFREPRHSPPLFLDFAPRKPYFSFNFISNLESLPTARWHTHKSVDIMRTLRLRVLRPLGRRRISYRPAIILFVASPRGNRAARHYINIHFSRARWYTGISRTVREIKSASRFEKDFKDPWRKNTRANVIKIWYFTKRHTMEYFICYWYWRYFMFRISWGKVLFTLPLF